MSGSVTVSEARAALPRLLDRVRAVMGSRWRWWYDPTRFGPAVLRGHSRPQARSENCWNRVDERHLPLKAR